VPFPVADPLATRAAQFALGQYEPTPATVARVNFEVDDVFPVADPLIEQVALFCFHDLIAAIEFRRDPARDIVEARGSETSAIAEAAVYRHSIRVAEAFNHHVQAHRTSPNSGP